jgi:hypothetical protein
MSLCRLAVAGLLVLVLWAGASLGILGCTLPGAGSSRLAGTFPATIRPAAGEVSRLLSNAHYYQLMGRPELAIKELTLARHEFPDNLPIINTLAQTYEELGQFNEARQLYQEALDRHGPNPALANNLCFSYYLEGRWPEAESCFRRALAQNPANEAARNNLGLLYCRIGRVDDARRLWQETGDRAAADQKTGLALAALGLTGSPGYAPRGDAAPPVAAAVSPSSLPSRAQAAPAAAPPAPKARQKPLAAKRAAPPPAVRRPQEAATVQPAVSPKPPEPVAVSPAPPAAAHLTPLSAAELMDTAIEIRNGTWTPDFARQTRSRIREQGFSVARIGNHLDFGAEKTMIYYRPGSERVARTLAQKFFPVAGLELSNRLQPDVDIKILLGADLLERPQLMAALASEG